MRPDGWWSISDEHGPVAYLSRKRAQSQLKRQKKDAPFSKWRVSRKSGLWELHKPYDRIKSQFDDLEYFMSCDPFTDSKRLSAIRHAKLLKKEALRLRNALARIFEEMQEDHDDVAFRIAHRTLRDSSRRS